MLGAFRVAFAAAGVALFTSRLGTAHLTGKIMVPSRGTDLVVTTADPHWFALAVSALLLADLLFAFLTFVFARQFLETIRS